MCIDKKVSTSDADDVVQGYGRVADELVPANQVLREAREPVTARECQGWVHEPPVALAQSNAGAQPAAFVALCYCKGATAAWA